MAKTGVSGDSYALAELPGLDRIRYTTSHPADVDDGLIAAHRDAAADAIRTSPRSERSRPNPCCDEPATQQTSTAKLPTDCARLDPILRFPRILSLVSRVRARRIFWLH